MKRYIRSASYTANFTSNDEWCEWISKKLGLDAEEEDLLLHDINNLRADEWLDVMRKAKGITPKDIREFKKFFEIEDEHDDFF